MGPSHPSKVAVLAIGSELLDGRTLERNAHFLCQQFHQLGLPVFYSLQCRDVISEISACLDFLISQGISLVVVSGGLGPTVDDRTRQAMADFAEVDLEKDDAVVASLRRWYESRGRQFAASNELQAKKPTGSGWIRNDFGTAPGFQLAVQKGSNTLNILTFPGVPRELRGMFEGVGRKLIADLLDVLVIEERGLQIFGLPESAVNDLVLELNVPACIEVIFNVEFPVIKLILRSDGENKEALESVYTEALQKIGGENIFANSLDVSFPEQLVSILKENKKTISVAESCTGGMIGSLFTSVPGCSQVFRGCVVSYSNDAKQQVLGVPKLTLDSHGAVSEEVAGEMAKGALDKFKSDIAISTTGIAGPDGGTEQKPVGTLCVGIAAGEKLHTYTLFFPFDRERFRRIASFSAMDLVRRHLLSAGD